MNGPRSEQLLRHQYLPPSVISEQGQDLSTTEITAWRITPAKYQPAAFDGTGSEEYGGRFNSVGTPVVYTSGSLSLATLEVLARTNKRSRLVGRICLPVTFEEHHVTARGASDLPEGWNARPYQPASQEVGDGWVRSKGSLVLQVPSVVVPSEQNYLINPHHPAFGELVFGEPVPLDPDPRLLREDR